MSGTDDRALEVNEFWFADSLGSVEASIERSKVWFGVDDNFDSEIRRRFGDLPKEALGGQLDDWLLDPKSALALIIALDQFPRNLYRDDSRCFEFDSAALAAAVMVIERGFDEILDPLEARFLYLPFEHSEDLLDQRTGVELFRGLEDRGSEDHHALFAVFTGYAQRHCEVIAEFGRFPHRNDLLGRKSTEAEIGYLADGGETF